MDNVEKYCTADRPPMTIWRMRISRWIPKALGICNIYCFSTVKMVARTRLYFTLLIHCLSCSSVLQPSEFVRLPTLLRS